MINSRPNKLGAFTRWWVNAWPHRFYVRFHVPRFLKQSPQPFRGEVLEVGAGYGWTSRRILDTFPQVELTLIDIDGEAIGGLQGLRRKYGPRLKALAADVRRLPFDRNAFDIVLAINMVRTVREDELTGVIQQILRVVRPGGLIGISEYADWEMRRESLAQIFRQEGCEITYQAGSRGFDFWIYKPYPVRESKV